MMINYFNLEVRICFIYLNEEENFFLDKLLDTDYLFINYPPSKFDNYLEFLEKFIHTIKIKLLKNHIY